MKPLIAFEFKKLLGRKSSWVALLLGFAVFVGLNLQAIVSNDLFAQAQGMKDVFSRYQGQEITEDFLQKAKIDYDAYVAANANRFTTEQTMLQDGLHMAKAPGYDEGVRLAFESLNNEATLEQKQQWVDQAKERLNTGTEEDGQPLSDAARRSYEATVLRGAHASVVRYAGLWGHYLANDNSLPGALALLMMALTLLGLFNGEVTARLEPVVLTGKARNAAVRAKLVVAILIAMSAVLLFYGLQFTLDALIWGTSGAESSVDSFYSGFARADRGESMPIGRAFALGQLAVLLAALCCSAVLVWASSRWRRPLSALLAVCLVLGGMIGLDYAYRQYAYTLDVFNESFLDAARYVLGNTPPAVVLSGFPPFRVINTSVLVAALSLMPVLTMLFLLLARRAFLRRRKV